MMFFFIFFFQTLVTIVQTIGFPGSGTCGIIMAITQFGGGGIGILVGIFVLAIAFGYGACAAGNIFMLSKVGGFKLLNIMPLPPMCFGFPMQIS